MDLAEEARVHCRPLRVLLTRLRYLGDVILTTPVITALKRGYPEAEIHYLAEYPFASVLEHHPGISGVIELRRGVRGTLAALRKIRQLRCTAAIDLLYNPRSAWLLYASGIPIRVGGSRRFRRRLYTDVFSAPHGTRSAIDHHLYPLKLFGIEADETLPRIYLAGEETRAGAALLESTVGDAGRGGPLIAVHPGGTWPAKRWSPASFARLVELLQRRHGAAVLVVTGPGEREIVEMVVSCSATGACILPLQPLRVLASVLHNVDCVIANDGGVLHMSVALGKPTVGIFGPTEPDIWFPYEGKGPFELISRHEECAPCHRHECDDMKCLDRIEPEDVFQGFERVMGRS